MKSLKNTKRVLLILMILVVIALPIVWLIGRQTATPGTGLDLGGLLRKKPQEADRVQEVDRVKTKVPETIVKKVNETGEKLGTEGDVIVEENPNYGIAYFEKDSAFLITIFNSPFEEKRALAEDEFLKSLDISKREACNLSVVITTPKFANPAQAGLNYRLSFCE